MNYCTNHRPCQNGGTCHNTGQGSFTCVCPPGFTGTECDIQMSDCENQPCLNGGMCHDYPSEKRYECDCHKGWSGRHCEEKTIVCAEKPCAHGTCKDTASGFVCTCPGGYSGRNCDIQIDECHPNPCENGGTCKNHGNSFQCACPAGFRGQRCDENINDCVGEPCQNGGTCVDLINQYRCQCVPGFIGTNCANKVDLCLTKPCANGGSCINLDNDYKCTCRPGFTGKDCSVDIDECVSMPCKNGGTCVNRVNHFQCVCPGGFQGHQCDREAASPPTYDAAHISTTQAFSSRSDGLSKGQVALIAILSIAMPMVVIVAACVVYCMKKKRRREQEKEDAEARKQNEQNATANMHHANSIMTSKRGSNTGLTFDNTNPTIIKNTWDKSVNNISSSASVDDCLMNTSLYSGGGGGAGASYTDSDCYNVSQMSPLQRARSQKQLNTDPSLMHHRASQVIQSKDYMMDHKRISMVGGSASNGGAGNTNGACSSAAEPLFCGQSASQRWTSSPMSGTTRPYVSCSPSHM